MMVSTEGLSLAQATSILVKNSLICLSIDNTQYRQASNINLSPQYSEPRRQATATDERIRQVWRTSGRNRLPRQRRSINGVGGYQTKKAWLQRADHAFFDRKASGS
ncbi:hypothetical protein [Kushneria sp. EE4]